MKLFRCVVGSFALLFFAHLHAFASSGGFVGVTQVGCTCHGSASSGTSLSIPERSGAITVKAGETLSLSLMVAHSSQSRTGINLAVQNATGTNAGTLQAGNGSQLIGGELTHSFPQSFSGGSVSFPFQWTAPTTPGTYTLRAVANAVNGDGGTSGDGWNFLAPITITVEPPTPAGFTVSGRILNPSGVGVAGVTVNLTGNNQNLSATTDAQGAYSIPNVPNGAYRLIPSLANWIFEPTILPSVAVNGANVMGQNIIARRLWAISGTVQTQAGVPVSDVLISATLSSGSNIVTSATTDARGNYTLWVLNGTYTIRASRTNWIFAAPSFTQTVNGANLDNVNLLGTRLWAVTGTIVNQNNEPLPNVTMSASSGIGVVAASTATTDVQGNYTLWLPNGTYTITPSRTNWAFMPTTLTATVAGANLALDRTTGRLVMSVRTFANEITVQTAPNPASEQVVISYTLSSPQPTRIDLFSITGKQVRSFGEQTSSSGKQTSVIDVQDLPTGMYFVRIQAGTELLRSSPILVRKQ
ncbi:MAG: T9SS C-terminal target domain-containing protein [Candidatus Kapaibacterium sp.]|nr:MAG: T9SS C-terminal target domain-containing protein [Candidatus Kapabacteria bacterium]